MTYSLSPTYDLSAVHTLLGMLRWKRPAGSKTERRFIREYIMPLGVQQDRAGNLFKRIGDAPVMWSCHTDTVHHSGGTQHVKVKNGIAALTPDSKSNCLGADDTAGVWIMREMIRAERPGLYVFHRSEEVGGLGSDYIASKTPELVDGIGCAIALDRMGTTDVITHQGLRCCSDAFAVALAGKLGMGYAPSDAGVFTDTANYTGIIGECTNLSVGYYRQHTASESLDVTFAVGLRDILLSLDARDLPIVRKPGEFDDEDFHCRPGDYSGSAYGSFGGLDMDDHYQQMRMCDLVEAHPQETADILREYGLTTDDLLSELYARGAVVSSRR